MNNDSLRNEPALRRAERGYNLVEVLVAMGILASVLISIFTLFFMGRYNVYSGKQMTQAVAIGNHVLEDIAPLNKKMIYNGTFAITDTSTGLATPIVFANPGQSYSNSRIRSTDPNVIPSPPSDLQTQSTAAGAPDWISPTGSWTQLLGTSFGKANKASITLILTPRNDTAGNSPAQFGTAATMRVRVLVRWIERNRQRQVTLDTVKSY